MESRKITPKTMITEMAMARTPQYKHLQRKTNWAENTSEAHSQNWRIHIR
jgi:hypothetical protein